MCPPDQLSDETDHSAGDNAARGTDRAAQPNTIVGPLTDEELRAGGMRSVVTFVRTERSKASIRRERHRKTQLDAHKRQINVSVGDDDRSRATVRGTAATIENEVFHRAIELLLTDENLRRPTVDIAGRTELRDLVELIQQGSPAMELLEATKLIVNHPEIAALMQRITATKRMREAAEVAAANPEFVFSGCTAATERSVCARLERIPLRIRRPRSNQRLRQRSWKTCVRFGRHRTRNSGIVNSSPCGTCSLAQRTSKFSQRSRHPKQAQDGDHLR